MATWIVHLRIAEALLQKIQGLDPAIFAIGNIAPDSGIPDEKWERFSPPPEVTHFQNSTNPNRDLADLDFFKHYLFPLRETQVDNACFSFRFGYFCHLVSDNLWSRHIGRPTKERYGDQFTADPKFIWEVKEDWYGLDFIFVRDHPDSLFWQVFLHAQIEATGFDFLPIEALRQRISYIKAYYQRQDEEIQAFYHRPYQYLSQQEMDRFIILAAKELECIYHQLWVNGDPLPDAASIVE